MAKRYDISVTYTPSVQDAARLNVPDMLAFADAALTHIFEAERLTDLRVVERTGASAAAVTPARVWFTCESCRHAVSSGLLEDNNVECPDCTHTVHADVYLGFGEAEKLRTWKHKEV